MTQKLIKLPYRFGKEGFMPKQIIELDDDTIKWITYQSNQERQSINSAELIAPILGAQSIQPLLMYVEDLIEKYSIVLDLTRVFEYKNLSLTLYYYLLVRGEIENNPELISLAETVDIITALGIAEVTETKISPENAMLMYVSGLKTGVLNHYEKINRPEGLAEHNEKQQLEANRINEKLLQAARECRLFYSGITKKEIAEMLAGREDLGNLSANTIVKKLKNL
ncbi:TPA: hypothetical protein ACGUMO_003609 [Vibrio vulnificus]